jgi:hypothetical protein
MSGPSAHIAAGGLSWDPFDIDIGIDIDTDTDRAARLPTSTIRGWTNVPIPV